MKERPLQRSAGAIDSVLKCYGSAVGRWPWVFIFLPSAASIILSALFFIGYVPVEGVDNIMDLFGPFNAESDREERLYRSLGRIGSSLERAEREKRQLYNWTELVDMFGSNGTLELNWIEYNETENTPMIEEIQKKPTKKRKRPAVVFEEFFLFVYSDDRAKSVISRKGFTMIRNTDAFVKQQLTINDGTLNYRTFCDEKYWCTLSNQNIWLTATELMLRNHTSELYYPFTEDFGQNLPVFKTLYGVTVDRTTRKVKGAQLAWLHYKFSFRPEGFSRKNFDTFVTQMDNTWSTAARKSGFETILINTDHNVLVEEYKQIQRILLPFLGISAILLILFSFISNFSLAPLENKGLVGIAALCSVILSIGVSFPLFFLVSHVPYNPLMTLSPFLALSLGIDDAYLLMGAWSRSNFRLTVLLLNLCSTEGVLFHIKQSDLVNQHLVVPERMSETLLAAGLSITLTTFTDLLCLGIGAALAISAGLNHFCLFACTSLSFAYLFVVTFFAAVVALAGRREAGIRKTERLCCFGTAKAVARKPRGCGNLMCIYRKFLASRIAQLAVTISYAVYFCVSLFGCSISYANMSTSKFFLDNSQFNHYFTVLEKYTASDGVYVNIVIRNAPNLANGTSRAQFLEMVRELETLRKYSTGPSGTELWLTNYLRFFQFLSLIQPNGDIPEFYREDYLDEHEDIIHPNVRVSKDTWTGKDGEEHRGILAFTFRLVYYGMRTWAERAELLQMLRRIFQKYPAYEASLHSKISALVDQQVTTVPGILATMGVAIIAIWAATTLVFFAGFVQLLSLKTTVLLTLRSGFVQSLALFSIELGIIGCLTFWGVDLDFVSLVCILITVGVAIDFVSHFVYKFEHLSAENLLREGTPELFKSSLELVLDTMSEIGWPVLQAGLSTFFGIVALAFVPSYLVTVFFKSLFLMVLFGLFHGLILLPMLYSLLL